MEADEKNGVKKLLVARSEYPCCQLIEVELKREIVKGLFAMNCICNRCNLFTGKRSKCCCSISVALNLKSNVAINCTQYFMAAIIAKHYLQTI